MTWLRAQDRSTTAHLMATVLFIGAIIWNRAAPTESTIHVWIVNLGALGFAIGFVLAAWPHLESTWRHPAGKILIATMHLFILLLAAVLARELVAASLRMPPQDFDITVSVLTLLLYIPAWAFAVSLLSGVIGLGLMLRVFVDATDSGNWVLLLRPLANAIGAVMFTALVAASFGAGARGQAIVYPAIRWIAVLSDFHSIPDYPCAPKNTRLHVHENGVLSLAKLEGLTLDVRVGQITPCVDSKLGLLGLGDGDDGFPADFRRPL